MALWQEGMIRLARSDRVGRLAQGQQWLQGLASQFVAGTTVDDGLERAAALATEGITASLFYLGEYVNDPATVADTVSRLRAALAGCARRGLDVAVSVDPTQIGLMDNVETFTRHARTLAGAILALRAQPVLGHDALMIDMEDVSATQATIDVYRQLRGEGLPVAIAIQTYLHRTRADLDELAASGAWVRLVKGAFAEPADQAVRSRADRDSRYRQGVATLLSTAARQSGTYPTFATHDHRIIAEILTQARAHGWDKDAFEFEMLYGVRPELQRELARRGHRVRVYLPFGSEWFPYAIRRVGEAPRNLRFAASALVAGRRARNPGGG
jgi:proline dehydrogenase